MKKIIFLIIILFIASSAIFADNVSFVSLGWNAGFYYHTIQEGLNLNNFRLGGGLDFMVNIMPTLGLGVEADMILGQRMQSFQTVEMKVDFPLRATVTLRFLDSYTFQPFGGLYLTGSAPVSTGAADADAADFVFTTNYEAGFRLGAGDNSFIFLEFAQVFGDTSFTRFGIGFRKAFF